MTNSLMGDTPYLVVNQNEVVAARWLQISSGGRGVPSFHKTVCSFKKYLIGTKNQSNKQVSNK